MRTSVTRTSSWDTQRAGYGPATLGMNYAILNNHGGTQILNWLGSAYDGTKADLDLAQLQGAGLTKLRAFMPIESWMDYSGGSFTLNATYKANAHDFLTKAAARGISVIVVLSRGETATTPANLDGQTRWDLFQTGAGITAYTNAMTAAVTELNTHTNILAFEMINEPYSNASGFSSIAAGLGVTQAQVQAWLSSVYMALKAVTNKPVCFSEYEEEEQAKYQYFSNLTTKATLINPYTDIYSVHIYRPGSSYVSANFRYLTDKPLWISEVGAINYSDPTASQHPLAGNNELYNPLVDPATVRDITRKALNAGASLVMPWSMSDNASVLTHNGDGSHTYGELLNWAKSLTTARRTASTRTSA